MAHPLTTLTVDPETSTYEKEIFHHYQERDTMWIISMAKAELLA
jgi:hypothetical protein